MPSVGLVTEQFRGLAEATARGRKNPDLALLVFPAGYDELPEAVIRTDARRRLPELVRALTGG